MGCGRGYNTNVLDSQASSWWQEWFNFEKDLQSKARGFIHLYIILWIFEAKRSGVAIHAPYRQGNGCLQYDI